MTSTTLPSQGLAPVRPQAVGEALRELSSAAQGFGAAVWAAVAVRLSSAGLKRRSSPAQAPSRAEEAARVRELAVSYHRTDPGFAADLYAAADRYERAHEL